VKADEGTASTARTPTLHRCDFNTLVLLSNSMLYNLLPQAKAFMEGWPIEFIDVMIETIYQIGVAS
jgi:hypothetical protein